MNNTSDYFRLKSKIAGTKRRQSFENEEVKKKKREIEMDIISKIENDVALLEKLSLSTNLKIDIMTFRLHLNEYKNIMLHRLS